MQPLVSIVTPIYNNEGVIGETIQSVLDQSYTNWELLLVNDGSIDNSSELANEHVAKDPRIQLFEFIENRGAAEARNQGSEMAKGDYIAFLDADDLWHNQKLEIQLKLFLDSVDRVASVSLDKKDGVKFNLNKDILNLSVNNTNSGDGKESLTVKFDHDLEISFNSRYLIDVASQLDGDKIEIFFNDTGSPALIKDPGDFDSIFVIMPMKG